MFLLVSGSRVRIRWVVCCIKNIWGWPFVQSFAQCYDWALWAEGMICPNLNWTQICPDIKATTVHRYKTVLDTTSTLCPAARTPRNNLAILVFCFYSKVLSIVFENISIFHLWIDRGLISQIIRRLTSRATLIRPQFLVSAIPHSIARSYNLLIYITCTLHGDFIYLRYILMYLPNSYKHIWCVCVCCRFQHLNLAGNRNSWDGNNLRW